MGKGLGGRKICCLGGWLGGEWFPFASIVCELFWLYGGGGGFGSIGLAFVFVFM